MHSTLSLFLREVQRKWDVLLVQQDVLSSLSFSLSRWLKHCRSYFVFSSVRWSSTVVSCSVAGWFSDRITRNSELSPQLSRRYSAWSMAMICTWPSPTSKRNRPIFGCSRKSFSIHSSASLSSSSPVWSLDYWSTLTISWRWEKEILGLSPSLVTLLDLLYRRLSLSIGCNCSVKKTFLHRLPVLNGNTSWVLPKLDPFVCHAFVDGKNHSQSTERERQRICCFFPAR